MSPDKIRCPWPGSNELMIRYHDEEWGVPVHEDRKLFEFMVLDSFQAGLSWQIVLNKREGFRSAFADFNPEEVAQFGKKEIEILKQDKSIIRNQLKIKSTISNSQHFIDIQNKFGSFDKFIWQFTEGITLVNKWENMDDIPVSTAESDAMSDALINRGFKFVGTTICYAFMQAAGMVNDHLISCFRYNELKGFD
ncbi:MAG: DNA-3-methyladenine glycosylase I [Candidatus Marinimicrobia bacterium]|nr:DNA-3-methyladenine glycosylase I [Candidatus Neomarinimicrobiota bacterium]